MNKGGRVMEKQSDKERLTKKRGGGGGGRVGEENLNENDNK